MAAARWSPLQRRSRRKDLEGAAGATRSYHCRRRPPPLEATAGSRGRRKPLLKFLQGAAAGHLRSKQLPPPAAAEAPRRPPLGGEEEEDAAPPSPEEAAAGD